VRLVQLRRTGSPILMARKRKRLVISGERVVLDAPWADLFVRRGKVEYYWKSRAEARKRSYTPLARPLL
jgi:hypothetical protein